MISNPIHLMKGTFSYLKLEFSILKMIYTCIVTVR